MSTREIDRITGEVNRHLDAYRVRQAWDGLATLLTRAGGDDPRVRRVHHRCICVANAQGGARRNTPVFCGGITDPEVRGDMLCDGAIGYIVHRGWGGVPYQTVALLLSDAERDHRNDSVRLARITCVRGQLEFARGRYASAQNLHAAADQEFVRASRRDPRLQATNLVEWLRAEVALDRSDRRLVTILAGRIEREGPLDMAWVQRGRQVLLGKRGLLRYRQLEKSCWS